MATYPDIDQSFDSSVRQDGGVSLDEADDGSLRGRSAYAENMYDLEIIHPWISTTDKNTLLTFYDTNKTAVNTFTLDADGNDYSVVFVQPPAWKKHSATHWTVTMYMRGTQV